MFFLKSLELQVLLCDADEEGGLLLIAVFDVPAAEELQLTVSMVEQELLLLLADCLEFLMRKGCGLFELLN